MGPKKIYALLNKIILTFNGLLVVFIIIRTIPKYEFGLLTLITTFDLVVFSVSGGVVLQALQKYTAEAKDDELNDIATNSVVLYLVLSLVPAFLIAVFSTHVAAFLNAESLAPLLKLLPVIVLSQIGRKLAYYILLAKEKVKEVFWVDFVPFVITAILIFALYFSGNLDSALNIVIIRIVANFGAAIVSFVYLRKVIKLNSNFNKYWTLRLLNFGKYSFGTTVGSIIHTRTDTLMIAYFYDPFILAAYHSAKGIADFFRNFVQAANMIVLPRASNLFSRGDSKGVKNIYYKGLIYSFILVAPFTLTMILFPSLILYLAYGNKYLDNTNILRIFALCSLMSPFGTIGSSIAGGIGKPNWTFLAMWLSIIVNVSLNLILIPKFGAVGAAYATLAALIVGGVTITCLIDNKLKLAITGKAESLAHEFNVILKTFKR